MEEIKRKIYFKFFKEIEDRISNGTIINSEYRIDGKSYRIINENLDIEEIN